MCSHIQRMHSNTNTYKQGRQFYLLIPKQYIPRKHNRNSLYTLRHPRTQKYIGLCMIANVKAI